MMLRALEALLPVVDAHRQRPRSRRVSAVGMEDAVSAQALTVEVDVLRAVVGLAELETLAVSVEALAELILDTRGVSGAVAADV